LVADEGKKIVLGGGKKRAKTWGGVDQHTKRRKREKNQNIRRSFTKDAYLTGGRKEKDGLL